MIGNARRPAERPELPAGCRYGNKQKMAFRTRAEARTYARRWNGTYRFDQYRCAACGWYHLATREEV